MYNKLKKIRNYRNLTQNELSKKANLCIRNYQNYEYGKIAPSVYTAIRLSRALGTTVEELFPLSDQTNENSKIL